MARNFDIKNLKFARRLKEGTYNGYIDTIKTRESNKDGTKFLVLSCVIEDENKKYQIDKYFVADDNDKLYYFLNGIGALKANGYADWDKVKEYEYEMQVYIDSKSGKCKIGEINLLYEDQEDEYEGYEDDDGGDYYEE